MIICLVALFLVVTVAVMAKITYAAVGFGEYLGGGVEYVGDRTVKIYSIKNNNNFRSITLNDVNAKIEKGLCGWGYYEFVIRYRRGYDLMEVIYDSFVSHSSPRCLKSLKPRHP